MLFPADLGCVRAAREWVAESVRHHGGSAAAERIATLLTSELVTNAVKYGHPAGTITVDARYTDDAVRVLVADASPRLPVVLDPPARATGGRGMRLVERLSRAWGVDPDRDGGKTVWFEVELGGTWPRRPAT